MTVSALSDLQDLLQPPPIAASYRDAATVISRATSRIQQCLDTNDMDQLVSLLEDRARQLALVASFDTALRDAAVIQSLDPSSAIGYQCAGDVYIQQGRQLAAINEYTKGLENMAVPDPQLERSIRVAKEHLSKKMDPVSLLPEEVVATNIIPRLMRDERLHSSKPCPYLYVSRIWRERVLQYDCLSFWLSTRSPHDADKDVADQVQHAELIRFAPFIKKLYMKLESNHDPCHILEQATFRSVRMLYVKDKQRNARDFGPLSIIQVIGHGLTHLDMDTRYEMEINLEDLMGTCPNLVSSRLGSEVLLNTASLVNNHVYPKMIHFEIRNQRTTLSQENLEAMFKAFPSLIKLRATHGKGTRSLSLIHRYCPRIQWIEYNGAPYAPAEPPPYPSDHHDNDHPNAIILRSNVKFHMDDVVSGVRSHADTLEFFDFVGRFDGGMPSNMDHTPVHFPRLIQFGLYSRRRYDVRFSCWMLSNSPNLEFARLRASGVLSETLDCLRSSRHLKRLQIALSPRPAQDDYHQALERFFQHHVKLGKTSSLETLSLYSIPPPSSNDDTVPVLASWLLSVAHLSRLKSLTLHVEFDMDASFLPFMNALSQHCHILEFIDLCCFEYSVEEGSLSPLQRLRNLKHVGIHARTLPEEDILHFQNFPALKQLYVSTNMLSQNTQDTLLASIEKVVIKCTTYTTTAV